MAQLTFPISPTSGQLYVAENGVTYEYDDTAFPGGVGVWKVSAPVTPLSVTAGSIAGTPAVGATLTYTPGVASGGTGPYTYTYLWQANGGAAAGSPTNGLSYVPAAGDVGKNLTVTITATDSLGATATATTSQFPTPPATIQVAGITNAVAPTTIPGTVNFTWADGSGNLSSTGCIEFSLDGGGTWLTAATPVINGDTVTTRWKPAGGCGDAASGTNITGTLTNGTLTNNFSLTLDRNPDSFTIPALTNQTPSSVATASVVTLTGSNASTYLTYTAGTPNTLTAVEVAINGGGFVAVPTSGTTLSAPPGATLQFRGTTGPTAGTTYTATINAGTTTSVLSAANAAASPSITTPSIATPASGATGVGTASGITVTGSAYTPLNTAGSQTSSTWEVYTDGLPSTVQSTNTISGVTATVPTIGAAYGGGYFAGQISTAGNGVADYNLVVAPVTSGSLNGQHGGASPTGIAYRNPGGADAVAAQNQVYGGTVSDLYKASALHPVFNTFINGATGPNAGAFNLATGGAGGGTGIGGYNDWYLPAKNELEVLYYYLKPDTTSNNTSSGSNANAVSPEPVSTIYTATAPAITSVALFKATGGAQAFSTATSYWSSTEGSGGTGNAWIQTFGNGGQFNFTKTSNIYARAVRRVATTGVGSTQTLAINAANTDGFTVGMKIAGSSSGATGTITAINGTTVTITQTSATNFNTTDKIQGAGTAITGSPFTVNTGTLTSLTIAKPPLAANTTYYARVKYSTTTPSAIDSSYSAWSGFTTGALAPGNSLTVTGSIGADSTGAVAYDGTRYVLGRLNDKIVSYSTDLVTWTPVTLSASINVPASTGGVVYSGTNFLAAMQNNASPYTKNAYSTTGITWTLSATVWPVGNGGVGFVIKSPSEVALIGVNNYAYSSNAGVTWSNIGSWTGSRVPPSFAAQGAYFSGYWLIPLQSASGGVVAYSNSATLATMSYTAAFTVGGYGGFYAIASSPTRAVAVGDAGLICTSTDGVNWNTTTSGTSNTLNWITYASGLFVAVGNSGTILVSSDDGLTWAAQAPGVTVDFRGVNYIGGQFVFNGQNGNVYV